MTRRTKKGEVKIKAGDFVRATRDCGQAVKKGQIYQVYLDDMNYLKKTSGKKQLAIGRFDTKKTHSHCNEVNTWELIEKPKRKE